MAQQLPRYLFVLIVFLAALLGVPVQANVLTDQQLFEAGRAALARDNAEGILKYLFAYVQRSPTVLQQDARHASQVAEAIIYAEGQLQYIRNRLASVEAENLDLKRRLGLPASSVAGMKRLPPLDPPQPARATSYPLVCRGGGGLRFALQSGVLGVAGTMWSIEFTRAAGAGLASLAPGQCAWMDRPVSSGEPNRVCQPIDSSRLHLEWTADGGAARLASRSAPYLTQLALPEQTVTFQVFNNGAGCLVGVRPPSAPTLRILR